MDYHDAEHSASICPDDALALRAEMLVGGGYRKPCRMDAGLAHTMWLAAR